MRRAVSAGWSPQVELLSALCVLGPTTADLAGAVGGPLDEGGRLLRTGLVFHYRCLDAVGSVVSVNRGRAESLGESRSQFRSCNNYLSRCETLAIVAFAP